MFTSSNTDTMYLNVNKISKDMQKEGGNSYTYTKISNLLYGFKGAATKKEIQYLRKLLKNEFSRVDTVLAKLENE